MLYDMDGDRKSIFSCRGTDVVSSAYHRPISPGVLLAWWLIYHRYSLLAQR